jgi:hypothetical protein
MERYDGPSYRVVRRYLREHATGATHLDTVALSAEFGLICAGTPLPVYDRRMTPRRAEALRPSVLAALRCRLVRRSYTTIFVNAGRDYLLALAGYEDLIAPRVRVQVAAGPPGCRLRQLRDWLGAA